MNVVIALRGYKSISKLTHLSVMGLSSSKEPRFFETMHKPVAGMDVFRSLVLSDALRKGDVAGVLFLDDDIVFNPQDVVKMVKLNVGLVGACYVTRGDLKVPASKFFDNQRIVFSPDSPLVSVQYLAGGFMLVATRILEKVIQANSLPLCNSKENASFWPFFMPFYKPVKSNLFKREYEYLTEDYAFCERVRRAGFDVLLDPSVRLEHLGETLLRLEHILDSKPPEFKSKIVLERNVQ